MQAYKHTQLIKQLAKQHGFDFCGIAQATALPNDAKRLEQWLKQGYHGQMQYMENYFDLRTNPQLLVPGAKSVITVLKNYYTTQQLNAHGYKVSKYAYGNDYHEVIKQQLHAWLASIKQHIGEVQGRGFVDSAPVLERTWALRSGLGWIGKNGNLINKQAGSFFFIASLIVDVELEYDAPFANDYCGTCTKCIDSCPTQAILPNKTINGSQCISYYTIELKDKLRPTEAHGQWDDWIFGCDICQDVCPWNRFSKPHNEVQFTASEKMLGWSKADWEALTEDLFKEVFRHSPIKRSKWKGLMHNIQLVKSTQ